MLGALPPSNNSHVKLLTLTAEREREREGGRERVRAPYQGLLSVLLKDKASVLNAVCAQSCLHRGPEIDKYVVPIITYTLYLTLRCLYRLPSSII